MVASGCGGKRLASEVPRDLLRANCAGIQSRPKLRCSGIEVPTIWAATKLEIRDLPVSVVRLRLWKRREPMGMHAGSELAKVGDYNLSLWLGIQRP
jgi:hypothetical protein